MPGKNERLESFQWTHPGLTRCFPPGIVFPARVENSAKRRIGLVFYLLKKLWSLRFSCGLKNAGKESMTSMTFQIGLGAELV